MIDFLTAAGMEVNGARGKRCDMDNAEHSAQPENRAVRVIGVRRHTRESPGRERKELLGSNDFKALNTAHFCSMKITEDVRNYAAEQGLTQRDALKTGMESKAQQFVRSGAELYSKA